MIFYSTYISHFVYPLTCWWTLSCFYLLAAMKSVAMYIGLQLSIWVSSFSSFGYIPRNRIADPMEQRKFWISDFYRGQAENNWAVKGTRPMSDGAQETAEEACLFWGHPPLCLTEKIESGFFREIADSIFLTPWGKHIWWSSLAWRLFICSPLLYIWNLPFIKGVICASGQTDVVGIQLPYFLAAWLLGRLAQRLGCLV